MATQKVGTEDRSAISRRAFLSVAMAASFLAGTQNLFAQQQTGSETPVSADDLHALSIAVIGKTADDRPLSDAFHKAFGEANPSFLLRASALSAQMKAAGLTTPAAFSASPLAKDPVLHATAIGLTAAWYLGHVAHDDHDDHGGGQVVAYEKALMWAPTADVTVIPSYSRGAPNYWAEQTAQIEAHSKAP